jgi:hypothetical protein
LLREQGRGQAAKRLPGGERGVVLRRSRSNVVEVLVPTRYIQLLVTGVANVVEVLVPARYIALLVIANSP